MKSDSWFDGYDYEIENVYQRQGVQIRSVVVDLDQNSHFEQSQISHILRHSVVMEVGGPGRWVKVIILIYMKMWFLVKNLL